MTRLVITLMGVLLAANSSAAPVEIRGARSCHEWQEQARYAKSATEMNKVPLLVSKNWFLGYLSGRAEESGKNLLKGTDNDSIFLWLDNYCRTNPGQDLANAGVELMRELRQQKRL
ncbi:MAG: hypothetical protein HY847_14090 [Betaproteobacteria bacterium]|nr:hypothetical protein [Betaproteobacteria bacterium]